MILSVSFCVLLVSLQRHCYAQVANQLPLLDGEIFNVSDAQIKRNDLVLDLNSTYNTSQVRLNDSGWCTEELGFAVFDPFIEINFDQHFTIFALSIGTTAVGNISSFRVAYMSNETTSFKFLQGASNDIEIFPTNFSEGESVLNVSLATPVVANVVRILPYEWPTNPPCLRLEIFGSLYEGELSPTTPPLAATTTTTATQAGTTVIVKNYLILQTLLPISVITIAITLVINCTAVALCLCYKKTTPNSKPRSSLVQSTLDDPSLDRTLRTVHNALYSSQEVSDTTALTDGCHGISASYDDIVVKKPKQNERSATYEEPPLETVPEKEKNVRPKIQPGTLDSHGYEFVDLRRSSDIADHKVLAEETPMAHDRAEGAKRAEAMLTDDPPHMMYVNVSPPTAEFSFSMSDMPTPIGL